LESYALDKTRRSIRALLNLAPHTAKVRRNGAEVTLPVAELLVGDLVVARPGERIPVDGTVVAGASSVNQAPITGESMPVEKLAGSPVFSGTFNLRYR
jgi:Cd2+/Zn2+-exporting ATPase